MGMKSRTQRRQDVLVTLLNPYKQLEYDIVIRAAESHEDAEAQAREELDGEDWTFIGSSTVVACECCGGLRQLISPRGHGAVGFVRVA